MTTGLKAGLISGAVASVLAFVIGGAIKLGGKAYARIKAKLRFGSTNATPEAAAAESNTLVPEAGSSPGEVYSSGETQGALVKYDPAFAAWQRARIVRAMQALTDQANADLAANLALARGLLSEAEYEAATRHIWVARMQYGSAVERLAARYLRASELDIWVKHVGGPGKPDFVTRYPGMTFDITTPQQIGAHLLRPYGPGLNILCYERPSTFTVFSP